MNKEHLDTLNIIFSLVYTFLWGGIVGFNLNTVLSRYLDQKERKRALSKKNLLVQGQEVLQPDKLDENTEEVKPKSVTVRVSEFLKPTTTTGPTTTGSMITTSGNLTTCFK